MLRNTFAATTVGCWLVAQSAAAQSGVTEVNQDGPFGFLRTTAVAVLLAAMHVLSPYIRPYLASAKGFVNSAGAGMACTYVFMHLIPEIADGQEDLGNRVYLITLLGFVVFYALEKWVIRRRAKSERQDVTFLIQLAYLWVYGWMIIYAMPTEIKQLGIHTLSLNVALFLHLLHKDYTLGSKAPGWYDRWGRYVLASAPLAGLLTDALVPHPSAHVTDFLTALMAGAVLYNVFRDELSDSEVASLRWFVVGVAVYVVLIEFADMV